MKECEYVGIWINVWFERNNDYFGFDEDYTSSGTGTERTIEEQFEACDYGKQYCREAARNCINLGITCEEIQYIWLLFNEPESNMSDPHFLSEEVASYKGVNVVLKNRAAYIGHFPIQRS